MEQELGVSLEDIFRALKRRLVFIIVIPLAAALLMAAQVKNNTVDLYTAQVKLYALFDYIDAAGTVRFDLSSSAYFISDYQELIKNRDVIAEASRRMGWTSWRGGSYSLYAVPNTRLLTLSVTSTDPQVSMDAANTLTAVFIEYIRNLVQQDSLRIASEAKLPTRPSNSGRSSAPLFVYILTLCAVVGVILGRELLNSKVRSIHNIEAMYHVNVLSGITGYKKETDAFLKRGRAREGSLLRAVNEQTQEDIRKLALNLQFSAMGAPLHTLTVTSTAPMEGKSTVALMLACELAEQGMRVLVVDMDYRSPMIGRYLGRRSRKDIMDCMNGSASLQEVVCGTATPNLFFIDNCHHMAVNPNVPSFDQFVQECGRQFDLVIFDTAPLGLFIDPAGIAAKSDGVLLVAAEGRVDRRDFVKVLTQLKQANARILGVAFNFVRREEKHYRQAYARE